MILPLALTFLQHVLIGLFLVISIMLILVILIQKGKGGGVGAAFGGVGASSLLGTKTGDFLTWVTISMVALFLVLSVIMGLNLRPERPTAPATQPAAPAADQAPAEDEALPLTADEVEEAVTPEGSVEGAAEEMTRDVPEGTEQLFEGAEQAAEEQAEAAQEAAEEAQP